MHELHPALLPVFDAALERILSAKEEAIKEVQGDAQLIPGITDIVAAKVIDIFQYLNGKLIDVNGLLTAQANLNQLVNTQMSTLAPKASLTDLGTNVATIQSYINSIPNLFHQADLDLKASMLEYITALQGLTTTQGNTLTGLQNSVNGNTTTINSLQTLTTTQGTNLANLQTLTTNQGASITNIQGLTTTNGNNITSLQGLVSGNSTNITSLQTLTGNQGTSITSLQGLVNGHTTNITTLQTSNTTNTSNIGALQTYNTTNTTNITALQSLTNAHESKLNTLLNTTIPNLVSTITNLSDSLSLLNGTTLPAINTAISNRLRKDVADTTPYTLTVAPSATMDNAIRRSELIGGVLRPYRVFDNVTSTFKGATTRNSQDPTIIDTLGMGFVWTITNLRVKTIVNPALATTLTIKSNGNTIYTQTMLLANIPATGKVIDLLGLATSLPADVILPALLTVSFSTGTFQVFIDGCLI